MIIAQYFLDFILFSLIGWVYECTYCMIRTKHWDNRGFLFGPICPIYGVGAVGAIAVFHNLALFSEKGGETPLWKIFLISMLGSAVLEFVTSWVLEKLFHAVWWDYSNVPLNIQGRISLPTAMGFGVAGIVVVKLLAPLAVTTHTVTHPLLIETIAMLLMAYLGADLALTVAALSDLIAKMETAEEGFNVRAEAAVQRVVETPQILAEKTESAIVRVKETPQILAEKTEAAFVRVKETPQAVAERAGEAAKKAMSAPGILKERTEEMVTKISAGSPQILEEWRARVYESAAKDTAERLAKGLNYRQKYALRSVRRFTSESSKKMSDRIKGSMKIIQERTDSSEEEQS